jgi:hypothetical protein
MRLSSFLSLFAQFLAINSDQGQRGETGERFPFNSKYQYKLRAKQRQFCASTEMELSFKNHGPVAMQQDAVLDVPPHRAR